MRLNRFTLNLIFSFISVLKPVSSIAFKSFENQAAHPILSSHNKEKKIYFEFGTDWKVRFQLTGRGGGSIDGGGGNVSEGQLLDQVTNSQLQILDTKKLKSLVLDVFKLRLQKLESDNTGFLDWLTAAFNLNWFADKKEFDSHLCKNKHIYKLSQKIVACQTLTSIHISNKWINEENTTSKLLAEIIIHELVRYHVIRLGKILEIGQESQDALVSETTFKILSDEFTPAQIFEHLTRVALLPDEFEVQEIRLNKRTQVLNLLTDIIVNRLKWAIDRCKLHSTDSDQIKIKQFFKDSLAQQKILSDLCRKLQDPNLTEEDPICSIRESQDNAINLFEKRCGKLE